MKKNTVLYTSIIAILLSGCGNVTKNKNIEKPVPELTDSYIYALCDSIINNQGNFDESDGTFSITKSTIDEFEKANSKFKDQLNHDTTIIKKVKGEINLPLNRKWKPLKTFKDTLIETDDTEIREFQYLGQFENIGIYVVGGSFWEHYECYLINKHNGNTTTIWNTPTLSPNQKYIASLSMAYGLEGVPNGIQIWSIDSNIENEAEPISINKFLEMDQLDWIPEELVWETNNSLILKVISVEHFMQSEGQPNAEDYYYLKFRI